MGQWTDRIKNHAVWQQMSTLGPTIDRALDREAIDPDTIDALERVRAVLALVGKRLDSLDPATAFPGPLDGLAAALQNANNEIQNYIANGNAGHISNANAHADTALAHLAQLPIAITPKELTGLREAASSYRSTLEGQLKKASSALVTVNSELESTKTRLATVGSDVTAEKQRLSDLASGFQSQFSAAQEARNREYTEAQGTRQEKFNLLMTDAAGRLAEQTADFTQQRDVAVKQYAEDAAALKENYGDAAKSVLLQIENHRADVEKLVGVIGDLGVTSGYVKTANYARKALWFWQGVAVLAMAGVIGAAYELFIPQSQVFSWEALPGRVLLLLTVGVLAAYAAFQADKYHRTEDRNRQLALELAAIGPFLAPLPPEKQIEFRLGLGVKTFGQNGGSHPPENGDRSPATVLDLAKSPGLRELVTEIIKAARG